MENIEDGNLSIGITETQNTSNEGLSHWNKHEKFLLMEALKEHGSKNIKLIKSNIPSKSCDDIQHAITYYRKIAIGHHNLRKLKKQSKVQQIPRIPLTCWAKILTDSFNLEDLSTETANTLNIIAKSEIFPFTYNSGYVDFDKVYNAIACAMEGKEIPNDLITKSVLDKCITDVALISKEFIKNHLKNNILCNINLSNKEIYGFPKPTHDFETAAIRHFASQRSYNPLNIAEEYLKYTSIIEKKKIRASRVIVPT